MKTAKTWDELAANISAYYKEDSQAAAAIAKSYIENNDDYLKQLAKELELAILANAHSRWHFAGLFEMMEITYDDNSIKVNIPFNKANTYRPNIVKSQPHYSFLPVLADMGWSVHGYNRVSRLNPSAPTFWYFSGDSFIGDAISEFNHKHASEGIIADFVYTEDDLGWL